MRLMFVAYGEYRSCVFSLQDAVNSDCGEYFHNIWAVKMNVLDAEMPQIFEEMKLFELLEALFYNNRCFLWPMSTLRRCVSI